MKYPSGKKQKEWIRKNLPALEEIPYLKDKMTELKKSHQDPSAYIYHECRCAVAHASETETTFDPESIEDDIRFYEIYPITIALAKLVIEIEYGIKTAFTIIGEHLYELEGFHQLLGKKIVTKLIAGENVFASDIQFSCKLSLRIWNKKKFKAFENLFVEVINVRDGIVKLSLTRDGVVKIPLSLDFPNERLCFEPMSGALITDNGSKSAALQIADAYRFYGEMIANGVLEVWDVTSDRILGRLLEYMPVNIIPGKTRENLIAIEKGWRQAAKERSS